MADKIGAPGTIGGGRPPHGGIRQILQEAMQLAPTHQAIQQDLQGIQQAHQQLEAQETAGSAAGVQAGAAAGQSAGGTTDQTQLSTGAQGISAAGPTGVTPDQKAQMHAEMAPYIQKLTQDVQAAQSGVGPQPGGASPPQPTQSVTPTGTQQPTP